MTYDKETLEKIRVVDEAFKGLEGIPIPYNLIVQHFVPLRRWINHVLRGDEDDFGTE